MRQEIPSRLVQRLDYRHADDGLRTRERTIKAVFGDTVIAEATDEDLVKIEGN